MSLLTDVPLLSQFYLDWMDLKNGSMVREQKMNLISKNSEKKIIRTDE